MIYQKYIKRILDFFLSLIVLVLLIPFILVIIILLAFYNRGQVFFFQDRPGKDERVFKLVKFKTMTDRKDPQGKLLPDIDRVTPFGKFLRRLSLDELPQLINVVKGDMSLVGPRPLLIKYLPLYSEEQKRRHLVRPGITGWAQVNGRNAISWTQKFDYDVWYVDNISFKLDVRIIIKTILKVIKKEGISPGSRPFMEPFNGNN